jgi:hypothetical protein
MVHGGAMKDFLCFAKNVARAMVGFDSRTWQEHMLKMSEGAEAS